MVGDSFQQAVSYGCTDTKKEGNIEIVASPSGTRTGRRPGDEQVLLLPALVQVIQSGVFAAAGRAIDDRRALHVVQDVVAWGRNVG